MRDHNWHGLTEAQSREYRQGKACEICGSGDRLVVDHDHESKAIRGVLCNACNLYVGLYENVGRMEAVAEYLKRYSEASPRSAQDFPRPARSRGAIPNHGTVARYNYRFGKCRCEECRRAVRERDRRVNDRSARVAGWGNPEHGTYAMYQQERKRGEQPCEACKIAKRKAANERYKRIKAVSL